MRRRLTPCRGASIHPTFQPVSCMSKVSDGMGQLERPKQWTETPRRIYGRVLGATKGARETALAGRYSPKGSAPRKTVPHTGPISRRRAD